MKNALFVMALLILSFGSCKTTKPAASKNPEIPDPSVQVRDNEPAQPSFSDPSTWILGYFNPDRLKQTPYSTWYIQGYDDYQINSDAINKLLEISKDNLTIKIVMGT